MAQHPALTEGRVAVITGAASGIGLAAAKRFAATGLRICLADLGGGTRRAQTLFEVGVVAAVGAVAFTFALHAGAAAVIPAAVLFGFGALGWNALVYVSAGERTAPELAGRSVAFAATVVFLLSALCTPLLGALADQAGWDVFWGTTAGLAALGALIAATLSR